MKRSIIFFVLFCLLTTTNVFARGIIIMAKDIGPELIREDFKLGYTSAVKGQGKYQSKVLYIAKYQVVYIIIKNNSNSVLKVNPIYFTLVSNMKRSYSYSDETYAFKDRIKWLSISPLQPTYVYPRTTVEGFLLFDKRGKNEYPKKLFFQNNGKYISVDVILDKKARYGNNINK